MILFLRYGMKISVEKKEEEAKGKVEDKKEKKGKKRKEKKNMVGGSS